MTWKNKISYLSDVQTGDNFLVRGKSFLSRAICYVMKKWAKKQGYDKKFIPLTMSHAAMFVVHSDVPEVPMLYGSTESGYKPIEFRKHYDWDEDEFVVMRMKDGGLSKEEKKIVILGCIHLSTVSLMYQYWNLIQWLLLVYLNINTFWKDGESTTFCYESCYILRRLLQPEDYPENTHPDIYLLLDDDNYEIIYISKSLMSKLTTL